MNYYMYRVFIYNNKIFMELKKQVEFQPSTLTFGLYFYT